jgi:hypothetical protein
MNRLVAILIAEHYFCCVDLAKSQSKISLF